MAEIACSDDAEIDALRLSDLRLYTKELHEYAERVYQSWACGEPPDYDDMKELGTLLGFKGDPV